ncbi:hypothetical protein CEXT_612811 [Caerostris extrusa]|uniref:Uncharacterized protein n=1 Tax=Caerostris extrusa TaxID=172846 RepID=A0AAV4PH74_CAEEX|nr:hypothetical protein CEXT_612811 [Caerostris extrusa]
MSPIYFNSQTGTVAEAPFKCLLRIIIVNDFLFDSPCHLLKCRNDGSSSFCNNAHLQTPVRRTRGGIQLVCDWTFLGSEISRDVLLLDYSI